MGSLQTPTPNSTGEFNSVSWTGLIFVKCWNGYMLLKRVPHTAEQPNQQVSLFSYFVVVVAVWSVNCTQPFLMVNSGQKNVFPWGHGNHRETRYDTDDLLMKSSSFHTRTLHTLSGVKQPNLAPWWVLFRSLVMMLFRSHQTMDYNHIANSTVAWTCNSRFKVIWVKCVYIIWCHCPPVAKKDPFFFHFILDLQTITLNDI